MVLLVFDDHVKAHLGLFGKLPAEGSPATLTAVVQEFVNAALEFIRNGETSQSQFGAMASKVIY